MRTKNSNEFGKYYKIYRLKKQVFKTKNILVVICSHDVALYETFYFCNQTPTRAIVVVDYLSIRI